MRATGDKPQLLPNHPKAQTKLALEVYFFCMPADGVQKWTWLVLMQLWNQNRNLTVWPNLNVIVDDNLNTFVNVKLRFSLPRAINNLVKSVLKSFSELSGYILVTCEHAASMQKYLQSIREPGYEIHLSGMRPQD